MPRPLSSSSSAGKEARQRSPASTSGARGAARRAEEVRQSPGAAQGRRRRGPHPNDPAVEKGPAAPGQPESRQQHNRQDEGGQQSGGRYFLAVKFHLFHILLL